jgi:hypothetical protein
MTQITIVEAPTTVNPSDVTTYFPDQPELIKWTDARAQVSGQQRHSIPAGSRLAALVDVKQDRASGRLYLQVANASCSADAFRLSDNEIAKQTLTPYAGSLVAATLTIVQRTGDHFCHGGDYAVSDVTLATLPLNPTSTELLNMQLGSNFVVQGEFVRYYEKTPGSIIPDTNNYKTRGYIVIDTPAGELTLDSFRPSMMEPRYESGVLENLKDKTLIPGEIIRINGYISQEDRFGTLPAGTPSVGYNKPYLLIPHPTRQADYDALRLNVSDLVAAMNTACDQQNWQHARHLFAELRELELTSDESRVVVDAMTRVPAEERSIFGDRGYEAVALKKAYGVNVETLRRDEFLAFAKDVLIGTTENPSDKEKRVDQGYLFRFWDAKHSILSPESLADLLVSAIPARFERLEQCDDEHDAYWDDLYLLESCIRYTKDYARFDQDVDPRLIHAIISIVVRCLDKGYYQADRDGATEKVCPQRLDRLLSVCFDALADGYMSQPVVREIVTPSLVNEWKTILNNANADMYVIEKLKSVVPWR